MKKLHVIICALSFVLTPCSSQSTGHPAANKMVPGSSGEALKNGVSPATDSVTLQKDKLTKIYSLAIAEYIRAVGKNDKTTFDALFFGKHVYGQPDDFPDIELPETIENTKVRLVLPDAGLKLQKESKSRVYINMMGWVNKNSAEFILVTFSNGGEHRLDCYINYMYNAAQGKFDLEKLRLEYFNKEGKTERIANYIDGKFVQGKK